MSIPAELASLHEHAQPATAYRPAELLRADLAAATIDLDLSNRERRTLDWLAGWDQDTVGPIITMLHKARRGPLEPPMPAWVQRYGR